ncbi:MAG: cytochrome c3 family protein [Planctomycetes bacterium]|nr:cytochrome c3 family protein [Planctomycetota bacterium]
MTQQRFTFPRWTNLALPAIIIVGVTTPLYIAVVVAYGFSPQATDVGYMPEQPIPFSHQLHAGELGLDCRYCHNTVEETAHAAIPPTETCMNCHAQIHPQSENLQPLYESYTTGNPIEWVRVHDLAQYSYFDHSAHVTRGVSCVECHGRVDTMEVVYQKETLSMGWCLQCHRNPDPHVRNPNLVTQLDWGLDMSAAERIADSASWRKLNNLNPSQDCSTCHR